jgi:hypothetical protein
MDELLHLVLNEVSQPCTSLTYRDSACFALLLQGAVLLFIAWHQPGWFGHPKGCHCPFLIPIPFMAAFDFCRLPEK